MALKLAKVRMREMFIVADTDPKFTAIGWTLTGTMNSPSTNLAWHYASGHNTDVDPQLTSANPTKYDPTPDQMSTLHPQTGSNSSRMAVHDNTAGLPRHFNTGKMVVAGPDMDASLSLESQFSRHGSGQSSANPLGTSFQQPRNMHPHMHSGNSTSSNGNMVPPFISPSGFLGGQNGQLPMSFLDGDMMIESQDVDMSMLGLDMMPDMMPWFDSYPPHNFSSYP